MPRMCNPIRWSALLWLIVAAVVSHADDASEIAETGADGTPAPAAAERPPLQSRSDAMAESLVRQLSASEFISLTAGETDFAALWKPANVGKPKGVVILLPGEGESADWPRSIGPLRRGLPDHGWHTLSLSLPHSPGFLLPAATDLVDDEEDTPALAVKPEAMTEQQMDDAAPNEAGYLPEETAAAPVEPADNTETGAPLESNAPVVDQAEQILERIESALALARSKQPSTIILLGQGTGGYWAARYLQQRAPGDVRHLGVIRPRQPEGQDESLEQLIPTLRLATGDFYYREEHGEPSAARARLNASRRIEHPAYRQVGLPALTGDRTADQEQLVRRVRGWLDKQR